MASVRNITLVFLILCILGCLSGVQGIDTTLTNEEQVRFTDILRQPESFQDVMTSFYAVSGLKALGKDVPETEKICQIVKNVNKKDVKLAYHAIVMGQSLGCSEKFEKMEFNDFVKDDSDVNTISYVIGAKSRQGAKVDDKLIKALETALKTDDSPASAARAFQAVSFLPKASKIKFVTDMVEDIVAQADEVDGKMLMFEGGLEVTAPVIRGIFKLSEHQGKSVLSEDQVTKFASYFLNRKYVMDAKNIFNVVTALSSLSKNKFHIPVVVSVFKSNQITAQNRFLKVRVTDVLDNSIQGVKVNAVSVVSSDGNAVIENKQFDKGPDDDYIVVESPAARGYVAASTHVLDVMAAKPSRGLYTVTVNVDFKKDAKMYTGGLDAKVQIKVLSKVTVEDLEVGVSDRDQSAPRNPTKVKFPDKLGKELDADYHQKIVMKFSLKEMSSGELTAAHQTFVRLTHVKTGQEIFFVAQAEDNNVYKFSLDLGSTGKDSFNNLSGKYKMDLIVGDATIQIPIKWHIGIVSITFADEPKKSKKQERVIGPKPPIEHMFRKPEKRPPRIISNTFTALLGVPFVIMFLLWIKIGANVSNFQLSITTILFHIGLAGIFILYYMFWIRLNMFKTLQYLAVVGGLTFLGGNKMLATMAARKQNRT